MLESILERYRLPGNPRLKKIEKEYVLDQTKFLISDHMDERLWYLNNSISEICICKCCDKPSYWHSKAKSMRKFCVDCLDNYNNILDSDVVTEQYSQELLDLVKTQTDKKTTSNLGRSDNYIGLLLKFETNFLDSDTGILERLWYISNNEYIKQKCLKCDNVPTWNLTEYREVCPSCVSSYHKTLEKTKATWLKNHGVDHPFNRPDVIAKRLSTLKNNQAEILQKRQATIRDTNDFRLSTLSIDDWVKKITNNNEYTDDQLKLLFKNCINNKKWLCNQVEGERSITFLSNVLGLNYRILYRSYEYYDITPYKSFKSYPECELFKFISQFESNIEVNTRSIISPLELDIYLPDCNLAIEYNGLYWHQDNGKNSNYHLNKTEQCASKGIQLFHIFENEWLDPQKQEIWKSIIRNKLGKSKRIFARKTKVTKITSKDTKEFLNSNHLQGACVSSVNLGLVFDDELVAVMTFGRSRYDKKVDWELLRYCGKLGTSIAGGAGKLLAQFRREHDGSIVSYADKRRSSGNLYDRLGFELSHDSRPNYWYFKLNDVINIYHRSMFMKHKLKDKLEVFDSSISEYDNMIINGWRRIFDCGNQVWVIK